MKGMGGIGPPLHQCMQRLVVSMPLSIMKGKDEILEPSVLDPILHIIRKLIVPHPRPVEIPSTFKSVGIKLHLKQGVNLIKEKFNLIKKLNFCKILLTRRPPLYIELIASIYKADRFFNIKEPTVLHPSLQFDEAITSLHRGDRLIEEAIGSPKSHRLRVGTEYQIFKFCNFSQFSAFYSNFSR